jgi:predicted phage terminase large subunit-like protein
MEQRRDKTVLGCVGIDEEDNIWVLPDLVWGQMETDRTVEELLSQFRTHKPHCWWMESELISKSFGPFLRKRMIEERLYTMLDPVTPARDKLIRARSIQGRMSMKKVFFPAFAPWFHDAKDQMLKFGSGGANDDFVDWLSWIGLGLTKEIAASAYRSPKSNIPKTGTMAWVVYASEQQKRRNAHTTGW